MTAPPLHATALLPIDLLRQCKQPVHTYVTLAAAAAQIIPADPYRLLLWFSVGTAGQGMVSTDSAVSATKPGLVVTASPSFPFLLTYWDHGPIVNAPWFGQSGAGATLLVGTLSLAGLGPITPGSGDALRDWYASILSPVKEQRPGTLVRFWRRITGRRT